MNWELTGWLALAASGLVILAGFFVPAGSQVAPVTGKTDGEEPSHPLHPWLEVAWPVFFIATMGMLTIKEVMGFAAVLLLATVVTGLVWAIDALVLARRRAKARGEPIVVEMAKSFFPVILIVFLLRSFLFEPFKIPSGSMVPSLLIGDFILVNKFTYGIRVPVANKKILDINTPKRGDVMVFRYPVDPSKDFIKRVVGLPGDTVTYRNKRLTINGKEIGLEAAGVYTEVDERLSMRQFEKYNEKLGEKPHTMMVDPHVPGLNLSGVRQFPNRKNCEYNEDGVTCVVPAGHYFMMGDSRDNSDDSRYWGFVPEDNIVGKAVLVWMNFSDLKRIGMSIE